MKENSAKYINFAVKEFTIFWTRPPSNNEGWKASFAENLLVLRIQRGKHVMPMLEDLIVMLSLHFWFSFFLNLF